MAQGWLTVPARPPGTWQAWGGFLPSLRSVGAVIEGDTEGVLAGDDSAVVDGGVSAFPQPAPVTDTERMGPDRLPLMASGEQARSAANWLGGVEWWPVGCGAVSDWPGCGAEGSKEAGTQASKQTSVPWQLYADDACDAVGYTYDERVQRARINMGRRQGINIAREVWTGDIAAANGFPNLSLARSATVVTETAAPSSFGLGTLQATLADCLGDEVAGIIHAPRELVTQWWKQGSLYWLEGDRALRDQYGNLVIGAAGYTGGDPDGVVDSATPWVYATGPLRVWLGETSVLGSDAAQQLQLTTNDWTVFVERPVLYQFDGCCVFGLPVQLCCDECDCEGS